MGKVKSDVFIVKLCISVVNEHVIGVDRSLELFIQLCKLLVGHSVNVGGNKLAILIVLIKESLCLSVCNDTVGVGCIGVRGIVAVEDKAIRLCHIFEKINGTEIGSLVCDEVIDRSLCLDAGGVISTGTEYRKVVVGNALWSCIIAADVFVINVKGNKAGVRLVDKRDVGPLAVNAELYRLYLCLFLGRDLVSGLAVAVDTVGGLDASVRLDFKNTWLCASAVVSGNGGMLDAHTGVHTAERGDIELHYEVVFLYTLVNVDDRIGVKSGSVCGLPRLFISAVISHGKVCVTGFVMLDAHIVNANVGKYLTPGSLCRGSRLCPCVILGIAILPGERSDNYRKIILLERGVGLDSGEPVGKDGILFVGGR